MKMMIEKSLKQKLVAILFAVLVLCLLFIGTASEMIWYADDN